MNSIDFSLIKVAGYRGRNFTLKMNPKGQNTVFIMDGNTGKTTTIELLRWCFGHRESEASGTFKHMWADPAHVLDDTKKGHQTCEITIQFSALDDQEHEHFFQLKRVAEGEHDDTSPPLNEKISSIKDTLEIDHGISVLTGDAVFDYVSQEFRFNECAEYFCFDGEKAREVMQLASDSKNINTLLALVNRRTTHPKLEEYKQRLNGLRERVLEEAKTRISDRALELNMNKLNGILGDIRRAENELNGFNNDVDVCRLALSRLESDRQQTQNQITTAKVNELVERNKYEVEQKVAAERLSRERDSIYENSEDWISASVADEINQIKMEVKEKGKLPEPYRRDLIETCLACKKCEICGRPLDKTSEERIKKLELQVAPHDVQVFLSSNFLISPSSLNAENKYNSIKKLVAQHDLLDVKIKGIKLSEKDAELIARRESLDKQISALDTRIAGLERDIGDRKAWITDLKGKAKELQEKNEALKENKIILDKIDDSTKIIEDAEEKIKSKATEIISNVISEGVSSILGSRFSARFTQAEGLMLGEAGFYGTEKGGYSGRLVLSYCFAEAMTVVGPIIVDTPAGNIGSPRENLASHLVANHNQVVLLCLPTELTNFANIISPKEPITIKNMEK